MKIKLPRDLKLYIDAQKAMGNICYDNGCCGPKELMDAIWQVEFAMNLKVLNTSNANNPAFFNTKLYVVMDDGSIKGKTKSSDVIYELDGNKISDRVYEGPAKFYTFVSGRNFGGAT